MLNDIETTANQLWSFFCRFPRTASVKLPVGTSGKTFVLVSGLPRSGTSLMMQMLVAGGMEAVADGVREADLMLVAH